jgi:hypothetical protein
MLRLIADSSERGGEVSSAGLPPIAAGQQPMDGRRRPRPRALPAGPRICQPRVGRRYAERSVRRAAIRLGTPAGGGASPAGAGAWGRSWSAGLPRRSMLDIASAWMGITWLRICSIGSMRCWRSWKRRRAGRPPASAGRSGPCPCPSPISSSRPWQRSKAPSSRIRSCEIPPTSWPESDAGLCWRRPGLADHGLPRRSGERSRRGPAG